QAHAVDQGAVTAAQVADPDRLRRDAQQAVLPADPIAVGPDVALGTAAEDVLAARETEVVVLRPSVDVAQTDDHGAVLHASPRPTAPWAPSGSGGTGPVSLPCSSSLMVLLCAIDPPSAIGKSCRVAGNASGRAGLPGRRFAPPRASGQG